MNNENLGSSTEPTVVPEPQQKDPEVPTMNRHQRRSYAARMLKAQRHMERQFMLRMSKKARKAAAVATSE
jgi:hypothetical protein